MLKSYWFWPIVKIIGKNIGKNISGNLNSKYSQKLYDHPKSSATDPHKTASKKAIQKKSRSNWWFDWW